MKLVIGKIHLINCDCEKIGLVYKNNSGGFEISHEYCSINTIDYRGKGEPSIKWLKSKGLITDGMITDIICNADKVISESSPIKARHIVQDDYVIYDYNDYSVVAGMEGFTPFVFDIEIDDDGSYFEDAGDVYRIKDFKFSKINEED